MATPATNVNLPLGLADILAAAERIAGAVVRTPTMPSRTLSERVQASVCSPSTGTDTGWSSL